MMKKECTEAVGKNTVDADKKSKAPSLDDGKQLHGLTGKFVSWWFISMSIFHLYTAATGLLPTSIHRAVHLTFGIVAVFLVYPAVRKKSLHHIAWYDYILAFLAFCCIGYIAFNFDEIARRGAEVQPYEFYLGLLAIILVIEAGRRALGFVLPLLCIVFLLYCYFGRYMPGLFMHRGYSLERIVQHMYLVQEGIFGVALGVSSTFVFMFILFGVFLSACGGARFFNDLSMAIAGSLAGGPAKVAIIASGFMGTINGSSIGNVATTGTFTIPLMKRVGYSGAFAGAIEACASTGGQLMPPIMGAGAFIMSEFLGISYLTIAVAAIVPAILFYSAIFIGTHLRAEKLGLKGLDKSELPKIKEVFKRDGHLVIPLITVIAMLIMKYTPLSAAFYGILSVIIVSSLRAHTRLTVSLFLKVMEDGARAAIGVCIACGLVGFIVGTASLTGLGLVISNNIIDLAGGLLLPTLVMSMFACLVLGMGLPTTANYIVTSTIIAPTLIKMNIAPLAAHLFVFYFGIMADITPPVCLAAFTGAGIAGANPGKTGLHATQIALIAYLLPFSFIYTPMMLMMDIELWPFILMLCASFSGIIAVGAFLQGWMYRDLTILERMVYGVIGFCAFLPNDTMKLASLMLSLFLFIGYRLMCKNKKGVIEQSQE